jgi:beta-lactamase regulating signal transducer with metallopeptidase domain
MTEVLRLVSHPLAVRMSFALLHFLWQGAALAGLALLLLAALRKAPASARYLALLAVFAAMTLCPAATFLLLDRAPAAPTPAAAAVSAPTPTARPITNQTPALAGPVARPAAARPALPAAPASRSRLADLSGRLRPALPWLSVLWLLGVVALSLRLLLRWWALRRVGRALRPAPPQWQEVAAVLSVRLRMSRPVRLMVSATAGVPMVLGWLRPVIVLPATALTGLTSDQLTALLAHELAHLRRHDQWVNVLQTMIELLLFYHPAVWWLSRALRAEREHCCDDIAVALSGDAPSYIRALAWVEEHRDAPLRPALAASGSPLLRRIRRLAGLPAPAELRHAWLAAALSLAMAAALPLTGAISRAAVADSEGHRPGLRDQWQPQTEHDPRLAQPVHIEILGRAAVPALEMLSKETGVSLSVAPENLETVGERKLTIIAQGCSLKSIMVQIPNALQECHWDIDVRGTQPVYLLHRNSGVDATMAELYHKEIERYAEERRPAVEARIADTRRALAMSPQELEELKKTDPLLAYATQDPETRKWMELFVALPDDRMREFVTTGESLYGYFGDAPERLQKASRQLLEEHYREAQSRPNEEGAFDEAEFYRFFLDHLDNVSVGYEGPFNPIRDGINLRLQTWRVEGSGLGTGAPAVPPQFPEERLTRWPRQLLLNAGLDEKAADTLLADLVQKGNALDQERQQQKRDAERIEPRSPALHRVVALPFSEDAPVDPMDIQRFIAKETGLTVISDYYSDWTGGMPIPKEAKESMPAWRLLYLLGEKWFWAYEWDEVGDCLVFHHANWYRFAPRELPESMVRAYREKLKQQGRLTLEDVVAAAVALGPRRAVLRATGSPRNARMYVPSDLEEAGLDGLALLSSATLIYASLSPEQRAQALSEAGLPYADMTPDQRSLARRSSTERNDDRPMPEEKLAQAVYHIRQRTYGQGAEMQRYVQLVVTFPGREVSVSLRVQPGTPFPQPAP